ncbi:MAG TPA: glycosyltransferase [Beijerinckiaceae bacterium]|nr:glycosyltransferase [Beijerinckiaceae bacterium]
MAAAKIINVPLEFAAETIAQHKPQFAIGIGSVALTSASLAAVHRSCKDQDIPLIYWLHDDPYEIDYLSRATEAADWVFTNDRTTALFSNFNNLSHLPLAASIDHHFAKFVPFSERTTECFFCGYAYPNRQEVVYRLRHTLRSTNSYICGDGWPLDFDMASNQRLTPEEMNYYYANSKLTLNIGRDFNLANGIAELAPSTPGPRTFEASAAGALQCIFLDSCEIEDMFELGKEMLTFNSADEFDELVQNIRTNPDIFNAIAQAAQERTRTHHTYDHRVVVILEQLARLNLTAPLWQTPERF